MRASEPNEGNTKEIISSSVRDEFKRRGIVKLKKFIPDEVMTPVREMLHEGLAKAGVCENGIWISKRLNGMADYSVRSKLMKSCLKPLVRRSELFTAIQSEKLLEAGEALVDGRKLMTLNNRPQLLFTPPDAETWSVPNTIWHVDIPRLGEVGCPGVQMFTFIDKVESEGGATLTVAGSHHYVNDQGKVRSKRVLQELRRVPWFKDLFKEPQSRQLLDSVSQDGDIELQLVELTGEPGDVYLMDLRVIHTLGPNTRMRPRLMASQRYYLEGLDHFQLESDVQPAM